MAVREARRPEDGREQAGAQYAVHDRQLLRFCRKLTGTAWDAEDLAQTTWMKVWTTRLKRASDGGEEAAGIGTGESVTRSYLYRIAANAWTDQCRRRKAQRQDRTERMEDMAETIGATPPPVCPESLQDAMERLVELLPPRQRIVLLLVEALRFTSAEAGALLLMTEGAVKAALHRARETLSRARETGGEASRGVRRRRTLGGTAAMERGAGEGRSAGEALVYAYLEAFRTHNVQGLLQLLNVETAPDDVLPAVQGIQIAKVRAHSEGSAGRASRNAAVPGGSVLALAA